MLMSITVGLLLLLDVIAEPFGFGYNIGKSYHCPNYLLNMLLPALAYFLTYLILLAKVRSEKVFVILLFLPTLSYLWGFGISLHGDIHNIGPGAINFPTKYESLFILVLNILMFNNKR